MYLIGYLGIWEKYDRNDNQFNWGKLRKEIKRTVQWKKITKNKKNKNKKADNKNNNSETLYGSEVQANRLNHFTSSAWDCSIYYAAQIQFYQWYSETSVVDAVILTEYEFEG